MKKEIKKIEELTKRVIEDYYKDKYDVFISHMDDEIVWSNYFLNDWNQSKEDYLKHLEETVYTLDYSISDMNIISRALCSEVIEVMVSFEVSFTYPDVDISVLREKVLHFSWVRKDDQWKIAVFGMANAGYPDLSEPLFPLHSREYLSKEEYSYDKRIEFVDTNHESVYIPRGSIIFAESKGNYSDIHTLNGVVKVPKKIAELYETKLRGFFRPHISFLVNLEYVDRISRYKLVLLNGKEIPIPEKKYNVVKEQIDRLML